MNQKVEGDVDYTRRDWRPLIGSLCASARCRSRLFSVFVFVFGCFCFFVFYFYGIFFKKIRSARNLCWCVQ